ncbi:6-carboxytetrahydropterin synthase QueD [Metalysinibacillus jejuensis]|uniref:6-carboxytetrahydropterin synthase QueD n=1 Tax=Metalysinibacillus jejuensis TaxID=914327 RepID=UPI000D34A66A|nr:6-carboxytetrahydropterin synthase QueD [Metalysinibacillus jejuensis]
MIQQIYPTVAHHFRYELNKDMNFSAAHFIPDQAAGVCARMHGHTYFVNVTIAGDQLDKLGFLIDFKALKDTVHGTFDHSVMNEHPDFLTAYPTTEIVASVIWRKVQALLDTKNNKARCLQVFVRETPTSYVYYRPKEEDFNA